MKNNPSIRPNQMGRSIVRLSTEMASISKCVNTRYHDFEIEIQLIFYLMIFFKIRLPLKADEI